MKTIILSIILLFSYSLCFASTDKIGTKVKFSKCYEYQESVKDFRKDKYPDFVSMQLYKVKNIFVLEVLKKDKSGLLYILTDSDLEKLKSTTPISQNNSYYINGGTYKEKIKKSDIRKLENECTEKLGLSISGYKKKFICIQFDNKHKYIIKYTNFIKLF